MLITCVRAMLRLTGERIPPDCNEDCVGNVRKSESERDVVSQDDQLSEQA